MPTEQNSRGRASVSPARLSACEILHLVETERAYASVLLATTTARLTDQDRALCYEIVLGVLRRQLWLDRLIEQFANNRPVEKLDTRVLLILRVGLYQLRFLERIPASAAVNEAVNMTRVFGVKSAATFVNAILRRAVREPTFDPAKNIEDPFERVAVEVSHPSWLIRKWSDAWNLETASAFARANNEPSPVAFRYNELRQDVAESSAQLRKAGAEIVASNLAPEAWRVRNAGQALRRLQEAGALYLQDEASQLVAHILDVRENELVLDVCAAPGSKTTHAGALSRDQAKLFAGDKHLHRLLIVKDASSRQRIKNINLVVYDAESALPFADAQFDRVLVDAPCSGTGTLRRNPEIRWRITQADIFELAERQKRILANAARTLRVGGTLVYSTCSVEPEENEQVVAEFLREHQSFKITADALGKYPLEVSEYGARTWTHVHDTDGFFIAPLIRVSD